MNLWKLYVVVFSMVLSFSGTGFAKAQFSHASSPGVKKSRETHGSTKSEFVALPLLTKAGTYQVVTDEDFGKKKVSVDNAHKKLVESVSTSTYSDPLRELVKNVGQSHKMDLKCMARREVSRYNSYPGGWISERTTYLSFSGSLSIKSTETETTASFEATGPTDLSGEVASNLSFPAHQKAIDKTQLTGTKGHDSIRIIPISSKGEMAVEITREIEESGPPKRSHDVVILCE